MGHVGDDEGLIICNTLSHHTKAPL
jgi:hypothetical protein